MCVNHRAEIRPHAIDGLVKRMFGRRRMAAIDFAVGLDANDVVGFQAAFIDAGRRDPNRAGFIANR